MKINLFGWAAMLFYCCGHSYKDTGTKPVSHELWTKFLKEHVSENGNKVDYKKAIKDSTELNKYLELLSNNPPDEKTWRKEEQMAYWINAYNAFTMKLIIIHYPVKSINDLGGKIPFVNSSFDIKFIPIGKDKLDLNNIEHGQLRKKFKEPRAHFAVNCASRSCPVLREEAYTPDKLYKQLEEQGKIFLADTTRNKIAPDHIQISKIFDWFTGDFTRETTLIGFLNKYSPVKINEKAKIEYMKYDWALNEK